MEIAGLKVRDRLIPPRMPKTTMKCQYRVQKPRRTRYRTVPVPPQMVRILGPFASNIGPTWIPQKKARKE